MLDQQLLKCLQWHQSVESCIKRTDSPINKNLLSANEIKEVFPSLKVNKITGFNVFKKCFNEPINPPKHTFKLSPCQGIFSEKMKIAKITQSFKVSETTPIESYRPISIFPYFSKRLE